jgi:hypothetical protein
MDENSKNYSSKQHEDGYKQSSKAKRRQEYRTNGQLKTFQQSMNKYLMTTRFNNYTWNENIRFREKNPQIGCIYGTPDTTSEAILTDGIMFVLEMNNDTNQIIGIGMLKNHVFIKKHRVYSNDTYNRYSYLGKHRIDRTEMTEEEDRIMKVFDHLCFRGARHMKRLSGLRQFPVDMLYRCSKILDLVDFITQMFKRRLQSNTTTNTNTNTLN